MQIFIQSLMNIFNKSVTSCFSRFINPKTILFNWQIVNFFRNLWYIIFSSILDKLAKQIEVCNSKYLIYHAFKSEV